MRTTTETLAGGIVRVIVESLEGDRYAVMSTGASLTEWTTREGHGIVAAYADPGEYRKPGMYLGTTVGLTAGRIRDGRFTLDGKPYATSRTPAHYLHCGKEGISLRDFELVSATSGSKAATVVFRLTQAPNLFDATVTVTVTYVFDRNGVDIVLEATTDRPILCNLTNHSYFNLAGDFDRPADDHLLTIDASRVVLVDGEMLGTDIVDVAGTVFDFRKERRILPSVLDPTLQRQAARGIDHYFLTGVRTKPILTMRSERTGLILDVTTDYPGTTVYTTNYPTEVPIQTRRTLARHAAVAIEPQFQSNGINDPRFPDDILRPEERYRHGIGFHLRRSR